VHALGAAPYGYRYLTKHQGGGQAYYQVLAEEARIVKRVFEWVGYEGLTLAEVCRRLNREGIPTRKGKAPWGRSSIAAMLNNPAYRGTAAYGRTRVGERRPRLRPGRGQSEPGLPTSVYRTTPEEQEVIPVPALVSAELFALVAERQAENKKRRREHLRGARHLLQGLLVCQRCGYAYCGLGPRFGRKEYRYYRCSGNDHQHPGSERVCNNKQLTADLLEAAVWEDVCSVLRDPSRVEAEFERRLQREEPGDSWEAQQLAGTMQKVRRGIARLIDSYEEGLLEKQEFEPRIRSARERLARLEAEAREQANRALEQQELRLVLTQLEDFAQRVARGLEDAEWATRRQIIRALVKRVEVEPEQVRVVYKVGLVPFDRSPCRPGGGLLQDCPSNTRVMPGKIPFGTMPTLLAWRPGQDVAGGDRVPPWSRRRPASTHHRPTSEMPSAPADRSYPLSARPSVT
jgi:site-specific DNA recombinase